MYLPFTSLAELVNIGNEGNALGKLPWIKNIKRFPAVFVCFGLFVGRIRKMTSMPRCLQFLNLIFELIRNGLWRSMFANVAGQMWHWWWHYSAFSWAYILGWATSGYHLPPSGTENFLFRVVLLLPWQGHVFSVPFPASLWSAWWTTVGGPRNKTCRISAMQGIS